MAKYFSFNLETRNGSITLNNVSKMVHVVLQNIITKVIELVIIIRFVSKKRKIFLALASCKYA